MTTAVGGGDPDRERREAALEEIRRLYPPVLTTAQVAELMQCTIGDVRDKTHRGELPAVRWGQQFRYFREEVLATLEDVDPEDPGEHDDAEEDDAGAED